MKLAIAIVSMALLLAACGKKGPEGNQREADTTMGMRMRGDSSMRGHRGWMRGGDMAGHMRMMDTTMMAHLGESDSLYDQRFIDMMIPHHEGAIAMAKDALEKATRPEIRTMAGNIIGAQQKEIDQMRAWRKSWYGSEEPAGMGGLKQHMASMNEQMADMLGAKDSMYEARFIDMMIPHHEGAVMMARDAIAKGKHAELKAMARGIIDGQEKEIAQMKGWRVAWYGN